MVLDNLREGVLRADIYDPTLNPLFKDVLAHYGVVAMPCRVRDPDRKGKVESGVGHAQKTPLKGHALRKLEEAQTYLDQLGTRWADTRIHGTTKRQVAAMFAEEKPSAAATTDRAVSLLPVRRAGRASGRMRRSRGRLLRRATGIGSASSVKVQWDALHVRILDPQNASTHARAYPSSTAAGYRIRAEDNPKKTPLTTAATAGAGGTAPDRRSAHSVTQIHRHEGEIGVRRILGVLSLAKKYGVPAADDACAAAIETAASTNTASSAAISSGVAPQLTLRQIDPLIRELTQYRDLINHKTKEQRP